VDLVEEESAAARAGLHQGDVLFEINGRGLLGCSLDCVLKIISLSAQTLQLTLWRPQNYHPDLDLAKTLLKVAQLLSCPICFREVALQPRQCRNGHVMCAKCAVR
jgi:PDZ domain